MQKKMFQFYRNGMVLITLLAGTALFSSLPALAAGQNISNTTTMDSQNPAVAISSTGDIHLVWEESDGSLSYRVFSSGAWGTTQTLVQGDQPALAVDGQQTLHLVWVDQDFSGNFEIFYMKKPANNNWSPPLNVSLTSGVSSAPAIAVTQDGQVHIVWVDSTPGEPAIYYSDLISGGPIPSALGTNPHITVDPTGNPHVVWQDDDTPASILYTTRSTAGWGLPEDLSNVKTNAATTPQIAFSGNLLHVIWTEAETIRATAGTSRNWAIPITLSTLNSGAQPASLAPDDQGHLHALWVNTTAGLRYTHRPAGGPWEKPLTVLNTPAVLNTAIVAGGPTATAHMVWDALGTTWDIYHDARIVPTLLGDLNNDCLINVIDFMMEAGQMGNTAPDSSFIFDGDTIVGVTDLADLATRWRNSCPPS